MGRKHSQGGTRQRSRLLADKEARFARANHAFTLLRPLPEESAGNLYELTKTLQAEEDIPAGVKLYNRDLHCSLIQERRIRRCLVQGFAARFAISTALSRLETGLSPESCKQSLPVDYNGADVIGRNRSLVIVRLKDPEDILENQRQEVVTILGELGLKMDVDRYPHITLGECKSGLSMTERKHVVHVLDETLPALPRLELLPIQIEHNGQRMPLGGR